VHYWVHGFHCYDNTHVCKIIALYTANAASACTHSVPSFRTFAIFFYLTGHSIKCIYVYACKILYLLVNFVMAIRIYVHY